MSKSQRGKGPTVQSGYVNPNEQEVIRCTDKCGADHGQYLYELKCKQCGHTFECDGTTNYEKKCPNCQGGKP